jgi:hypothetical protein
LSVGSLNVVASEAKQSNLPQAWIASSLSLLAMTILATDSFVKQHQAMRPHCRGAMRPGFASMATP